MSKETVVLVDPRTVTNVYSQGHVPIALLHLGTYLASKDIKVKIIDCVSSEDYERELEEALPDALCVGFTCYTVHIPHVQRLARKIKNAYPELPVVLGGYHPSLYPEKTLQEDCVDYVVIQEGEEVLYRLVQFLRHGSPLPQDIPGLAFKGEDSAVRISKPQRLFDIADMPPYNYMLIRKEVIRHIIKTRGFFPLITSKGCPYKCAFCINVVTDNVQWRHLSAERTVEEISRLRDMGVEKLWIWDENFYVSRRRLLAMLDLMEQRRVYIESWSEGRANYFRDDYLNPELLKRMHRNGFRRFGIGCESGSQRVLDYIDKEIKVEDTIRATEYLAEAQIRLSASFMIGLPREKREDIVLTLRLLKKISEISPTFGITGPTMFRPYPGSTLYDECIAAGWNAPRNFDEWTTFLKKYYTKVPVAHDLPWISDPYFTDFVHFYTFTVPVSYKGLRTMLRDYFAILEQRRGIKYMVMLLGLLGVATLGKLRYRLGFYRFLFEKRVFAKHHPNLEY